MEDKLTIFIIGDHEWFFVKALKKGKDGTGNYLEFYSHWLCNDNDCVELYIDDVESEHDGGFTLECFSGIPASSIHIDTVDFSHIQYIKGFPKEGFWELDYVRKCLTVADWLCEKFCEYHKPNK